MEPTVAMHIMAPPARCSTQFYIEPALGQLCLRGGYRLEVSPLGERHLLVPLEAGVSIAISDSAIPPRDSVEISFSDAWTAGFGGETMRSGVTGRVITRDGFIGGVEIRRLKQGTFPTAGESLKVCDPRNCAVDPFTMQPTRKSGAKTNLDEVRLHANAGAAFLLREYRSADECGDTDGIMSHAYKVMNSVGIALGIALGDDIPEVQVASAINKHQTEEDRLVQENSRVQEDSRVLEDRQAEEASAMMRYISGGGTSPKAAAPSCK